MPNIFEKIQARIELFRLEQRYTRNRHRRSTFISNAVYVDGEYVYQTPSSTGSSANSSATNAVAGPDNQPQQQQRSRRRSFDIPSPSDESVVEEPQTPAQRKRLNRFSSMPGFGSLSKASAREWRPDAANVREDM